MTAIRRYPAFHRRREAKREPLYQITFTPGGWGCGRTATNPNMGTGGPIGYGGQGPEGERAIQRHLLDYIGFDGVSTDAAIDPAWPYHLPESPPAPSPPRPWHRRLIDFLWS